MMILYRKHVVGKLSDVNSVLEFTYDKDWLKDIKAFPISLSLPLTERSFSGNVVSNVLSNLLPDDENIRRDLARQLNIKHDVYSLLSAIGHDCVGALQFLNEDLYQEKNYPLNYEPISDIKIAEKLRNLSMNPLGISDDSDFRISIAGVQDKTGLLQINDQWFEPHGLTPTTHILKPQIGKRNNLDLSHSVENEHFCLAFLAYLNLPVAKTQMIDFDGIRALVIERFDRLWRNNNLLRLPQEDCCQALNVPPENKYERDNGPGIDDILGLLQRSDEPLQDRKLFFTAQIVYWLLGAVDGHAKNFSIHLFPGSGFRLTPFYDVISLQPNVDAGQVQWKKMKFAMSVGQKKHYIMEDIVPRHFLETARKNNLSPILVKEIFQNLYQSIPLAIEKTIKAMPKDFPPQLMDSIKKGIFKRRHDIEAWLASFFDKKS